ncbi:hypothetical protein [Xanthovirga aplysinae]|uniref:hypothetical protein n=1 Tax=Xanthovirga aplysinae TaxID=2529853 RepID=UPI0012BD4B5D|nr:hypothetical protein [Xanthovirga aplysinae]MTI32542.1 hypothetical protein [Xanthovirga aplysinae]
MEKIKRTWNLRASLLIAVSLLFLLNACKEDFLNETPPRPDLDDEREPVDQAVPDLSQPYNQGDQLGAWLVDWVEGDESWPNIHASATGNVDKDVRRAQVAVNNSGQALVVAQNSSSKTIYYRSAEVIEENGQISLNYIGSWVKLDSYRNDSQWPAVALADDGQFIITANDDGYLYYYSGVLDGVGNPLLTVNMRKLKGRESEISYSFSSITVTEKGLIFVVSDYNGNVFHKNRLHLFVGRFEGNGSIRWRKSDNSGWTTEDKTTNAYVLKEEGQPGNDGMRQPSISIYKKSSSPDTYRILLSHHNGGNNYLGLGEFIDTGDNTFKRDDGKNFPRWKNSNNNFVRTTNARTPKINPSGTNMARSHVVLAKNDKFFLIYDNDNNKGRYITGHYKKSDKDPVLDKGIEEVLNKKYSKLDLKGGVSRVHATHAPDGRILVSYHNKNKDENNETYNIKYNFYEPQ